MILESNLKQHHLDMKKLLKDLDNEERRYLLHINLNRRWEHRRTDGAVKVERRHTYMTPQTYHVL